MSACSLRLLMLCACSLRLLVLCACSLPARRGFTLKNGAFFLSFYFFFFFFFFFFGPLFRFLKICPLFSIDKLNSLMNGRQYCHVLSVICNNGNIKWKGLKFRNCVFGVCVYVCFVLYICILWISLEKGFPSNTDKSF